METEILYIHYRRAMYMAAVSVVRNRELAEDAVQEVFLRLMDDPARLRGYPCAENRAYLLRAVRGAALNLLRRRNREAELDESHVCPTSTEDAIISHMGYSRLVDMIRALPPALSEVAMLSWVDGLSAWEIAQKLGIKRGTVYSHISRARELLKKSLEKP